MDINNENKHNISSSTSFSSHLEDNRVEEIDEIEIIEEIKEENFELLTIREEKVNSCIVKKEFQRKEMVHFVKQIDAIHYEIGQNNINRYINYLLFFNSFDQTLYIRICDIGNTKRDTIISSLQTKHNNQKSIAEVRANTDFYDIRSKFDKYFEILNKTIHDDNDNQNIVSITLL